MAPPFFALDSTADFTAPKVQRLKVERAGVRILIVEENRAVRDLLRDALSRPDLILDTASTCKEAGDYLTRHHYDLVSLCNHLPDGEGLGLARFINKCCPSIRLIMITSDGDLGGFVEQANRVGVEKVFSKPFVLESLRHTIFATKKEDSEARRSQAKNSDSQQVVASPFEPPAEKS